MTIKEFYEVLKSDYNDACRRLGGEHVLKKIVKLFLSDESFCMLEKAVKNSNFEDAFDAVHTLKGLALNLGFSDLSASSIALTEALRGGKKLEDFSLFERVKCDYEKVIINLQKVS